MLMNKTDNPLTPLKLTVFYDYICPFCYIGSHRILALGDQYDLQINWAGMEIHPERPPRVALPTHWVTLIHNGHK